MDNTSLANPKPVAFIEIPGNYGVSAKSHYLYADSYYDLIIFDISNPRAITQVGAFQSALDPLVYRDILDSKLYEKVPIQVTTTVCEFEEIFTRYEDDDANPQANEGVSGSMARFTVSNAVLYTVDPST